MKELTLTETADGSKTIWNESVGEHYHSKHGALQESKHVFLDSGTKYFLDNSHSKEVNILEVGFGTGLNFLLTADYCAENEIKLTYVGVEAQPLSNAFILATEYNRYVGEQTWTNFIRNYSKAIDCCVQLNLLLDLEIRHCEILNFQTEQTFDIIYFDAFAAIHQPEMWNQETLAHCCKYLKPGGIFVTYAITGELKRTMKALGFTIQKIKGAPGKREMLRAIKLQ